MVGWRAEEERFRAWYAWAWRDAAALTDGWMDAAARFQEALVARDVPPGSGRGAALRRLRQAHLYYPLHAGLQRAVQVRCNRARVGCGRFVDVALADGVTGERVLLSGALAQAGARCVLVVAGSGS